MLKIKPSPKNMLVFSVIYQIYPISLYFLAKMKNPNSNLLAMLGIFLIAEVLLMVVLSNWREQARTDVVDEREMAIRLKVKSATLRAIEISFVSTTVIHLSFYKEMPTLIAILLIGVPGILMEVYANIACRRI